VTPLEIEMKIKGSFAGQGEKKTHIQPKHMKDAMFALWLYDELRRASDQLPNDRRVFFSAGRTTSHTSTQIQEAYDDYARKYHRQQETWNSRGWGTVLATIFQGKAAHVRQREAQQQGSSQDDVVVSNQVRKISFPGLITARALFEVWAKKRLDVREIDMLWGLDRSQTLYGGLSAAALGRLGLDADVERSYCLVIHCHA
jgi:hypothetical protein